MATTRISHASVRSLVAMGLAVGSFLWAANLRAEVDVDYSVEVQNDIRFSVDRLYAAVPDDDGVGSKIVETEDRGFSRNEASVRLKVHVAPVPQVRFVGDVELVWTNMSDRELSLQALTTREAIDPWRLELDAAYVDIRDVAPGFDIRIGRQIVQWGSADMFNPTNNLNSDDIEDRAVFREPIANEMLRFDYTYIPEREGWLSEIIFSLVWVPIFRPSQLPGSAVLPLGDASEEIPVLEDDVRQDIGDLRGLVAGLLEDPSVSAASPGFSLENSQLGFRIQTRMINTDFTLSYYRGFDDIPVFQRAEAYMTEAGTFGSNVTLVYPRMHVFGFDINGQIPFLDDLGFWIEGAVIFPEQVGLTFAFTPSPLLPAGLEVTGTAVDDRPFLKLTAGIDYSFNQYVFMNLQYVRGMINEFGAGQLNNYLVLGLDFKFWSDRILLRLFTLLQLDFIGTAVRDRGEDFPEGEEPWREDVSANLFPMLRINPWGSIELDLGAIIPLGSVNSYFGAPETGTTEIFLRARAAF